MSTKYNFINSKGRKYTFTILAVKCLMSPNLEITENVIFVDVTSHSNFSPFLRLDRARLSQFTIESDDSWHEDYFLTEDLHQYLKKFIKQKAFF